MTTMTITDWETGEEVAEISDDGTYEAKNDLGGEVLEGLLDEDGAAPFLVAGEAADGRVRVAPGEDGYLYAVADSLPSPLEADIPEGAEPPDAEPPGDDGAPGADTEDKLRDWLPSSLAKKLS